MRVEQGVLSGGVAFRSARSGCGAFMAWGLVCSFQCVLLGRRPPQMRCPFLAFTAGDGMKARVFGSVGMVVTAFVLALNTVTFVRAVVSLPACAW